jgi:hypothetical protein
MVTNMDIGEISSDAAKYPLSDWKKVIILGVMFIASVLIIPAFFGIGISTQNHKGICRLKRTSRLG